jgi:hypothetical protein
MRSPGGPEATRKITEKRKNKFDKLIEYNNVMLTKSLLPSYRRMITIFRDNYYLAEHTTRDYFQSLIEFVNLWDRWLDKSIPKEVIEDLDRGEKILEPFYNNLRETHEELRIKLSEGKA